MCLRKTLRFSAESALYCSCLLETLFPLASNDDVGCITMGRIGNAVVVDDGKLTRRFCLEQCGWKEVDWRNSWRSLVFENHVGQKQFDEETDISISFSGVFYWWMVRSVWVVGLDCFLIPFVWYETSLKYDHLLWKTITGHAYKYRHSCNSLLGMHHILVWNLVFFDTLIKMMILKQLMFLVPSLLGTGW